MPPTPKLWIEVTTSEHAHERAALQFIRERFPTREPFRAWANFTFLAEDGSRNEVDLLVVSPTGVYLVEIKSHPGRMDGDAGTWVWTPPEGTQRTFDNPIMLAERKAKKLKSLLLKQRSLRDRRYGRDGFYLRSVVFLSNKDLVVGLDEPGKTDVFGPDRSPDDAQQRNQLPGLIELFKKVDPHRGRQVDRPLSQAIAEAVDEAGIRESTTHRQVGEYELGEVLDEGPGWQDFSTVHPRNPDAHRRVRIYLTGETLDDEERNALRRAAEREFKFLEGIEHPGIERPIELLSSHRGPALLFQRDPGAQRLDHWLSDHGGELDLMARLELVRQLAETLRHAHRQGLFHRALTPHHIVVVQHDGKPRLRIRDWQTALQRLSSNSSGASGTEHVLDHVSQQAQVYLAPETLRLPDPQPGPADIWSLGAVAFLILTGKPPAPDVDSLHDLLRTSGHLTLASSMDAPPQEIDQIIRNATLVDASDRFVSVDEFLEFLDLALDELTAPEDKDPIEASKGDTIDGTWRVIRRVGSGRTSVVLLAENADREEILKIARSGDDARRLKDECEILSNLRDRSIIVAYGIEEIAGRTVLRLEPALETLAVELRENGPLSLDLLERYGTDLLRAVAYLDEEGVAHRDIKPDNIGIAERGKDKERHLVLFDFSLSRTDPSEVRVGTTGYLDPFLDQRNPKRWDNQAERYALAVTLYEMATGGRPKWGDGSTDPSLTELELPGIEADLFDPSVREELTAFFRRALRRKPSERFDTIHEMKRAWDHAFARSDHAAVTETALAAADIDLSELTRETPLAELPLSAKVRNAAERLGAVTAGDLMVVPPASLVRLSGIGAATRRELAHLARRFREELDVAGQVSNPDSASIDRIVEQLVPKPPADEDHRTIVRSVLELTDSPACPWPTSHDAVSSTGFDRKTVGGALSSARTRWRKRPDLTAIREEIVELLGRRGGIAGADELAGALLAARGSLAVEPHRSRRARAVVRAAVEAESTLRGPRIVAKRLGSAMLLALSGEIEGENGPGEWDADALAESAATLGEQAEALAHREPLPTAQQVLRELRALDLPEDIIRFSDARIVRLAAAASGVVSVSTRLELYPSGMHPARALKESRSVLLARGGLEPAEIHARVRARFPDAAPLPGRPELDGLLEPLGLEWRGGKYVVPSRGGVLSSVASSTQQTTSFATPDERAAAIREADARLKAVHESGGFLALTVSKRYFGGAAEVIARRLGGVRMDLDRTLIDVMKRKSDQLGARWISFLDADNKQGQRPWTLLNQLVDRTVPEVERELLQQSGIVVITGIGLLARYGRMALVERLRDVLTRTSTGHSLRGVVLVVPGDDPSARPVVDGVPVPVITANQWAHLPSAWLAQYAEGQAA